MCALSAGIVVLTASMAILDGARAQIEPQRPPGSGFMQAPIGPRQPTLDHLQAAHHDFEQIDEDNHDLDLPACHDDATGPRAVRAVEDGLTERIEQDNPRLDSEITEICSTCGGTVGASPRSSATLADPQRVRSPTSST